MTHVEHHGICERPFRRVVSADTTDSEPTGELLSVRAAAVQIRDLTYDPVINLRSSERSPIR